ncbi:uncharacterized protein LOC112180432 isoform X2 [Rosa chinensis]|uniref:uncharacterized protein LOC112180432 isoform X2 n=1 Tax=Rosa chinensis TaxID=74649 RepID=UPI001AD8F8C2|nr:uncharacterized protein LOC112180432 isoform X2 [Rosa chinensis]
MEQSKQKLQTSDSQIPGSSCSLSIPSEPPDLGNWFSSYRYESPAMNSNSFRNEFDTGEIKRERDGGDSCGFMENGNKVGVFVHKKQNSNGVVKCGSSSQNQCLSKLFKLGPVESVCISEGSDTGKEISGSFESPSALSEPTHIKNWFSSYVYESAGFGDSLCKESKFEKDGFLVENSNRENEEDLRNFSTNSSVSKEIVGEKEQSGELANCDSSRRDTKQARQPVSEAPGPLESHLLLSEPIHIRNWFSSYVYESPSLDMNDSFGDSVCKESKCEKDGFRVEKRDNEEDLGDFRRNSSVGEEVAGEKKQSVGLATCDSSWRVTKHDRQPVSKVPGPLDSTSHLSEPSQPTDIRNWFSSYVYESPLDTADGFGDFGCRDRIDEKDEVLVEPSNKEDGEGLEGFSKKESDSEEVDVEKVQSEEFITSCRCSVVDPTTGVDENLSGRNDLCLEFTPKTVQNHDTSQAKHGDTSSFNKGDSQCKRDQETFHGTRFKPSNKQRSMCSNDGKCPQNLIQSSGSTLQESSEATVHAEDCVQFKSDSELIPVKGASVSKSTHGSKERKDGGKGISEDGFITTRKRKFTARNDENSAESSKGTVPLAGRKDVAIKRKTLADTTNFHHSPATMITGKWRRPQQRKPNLRPPLKQLGLEQWIQKL